MIPMIMPPLAELTILVTRPEPRTTQLCERIRQHGGEALALPAVAIEPLPAEPADAPDMVVFLSVHAVAHGVHLVQQAPGLKVAAIGRATAAALAEAGLPAQIVPDAGFTSEALLAHPALASESSLNVLIVRGEGGRQVLPQAFAEKGWQVTVREVYRRIRPAVAAQDIAAIEQHWSEAGIDAVTLTSVETMQNLIELLTARGRELLASTAVVAPSERILEAARAAGLAGTGILAAAADDDSLIGALARWHMRAREH